MTDRGWQSPELSPATFQSVEEPDTVKQPVYLIIFINYSLIFVLHSCKMLIVKNAYE